MTMCQRVGRQVSFPYPRIYLIGINVVNIEWIIMQTVWEFAVKAAGVLQTQILPHCFYFQQSPSSTCCTHCTYPLSPCRSFYRDDQIVSFNQEITIKRDNKLNFHSDFGQLLHTFDKNVRVTSLKLSKSCPKSQQKLSCYPVLKSHSIELIIEIKLFQALITVQKQTPAQLCLHFSDNKNMSIMKTGSH